jgi:hypothetical protein
LYQEHIFTCNGPISIFCFILPLFGVFFNETLWFEMVQMATIQDPLATIKDISFKSDMVICVSSGTIIWLLICDLEK